jgi:hypothetical protein
MEVSERSRKKKGRYIVKNDKNPQSTVHLCRNSERRCSRKTAKVIHISNRILPLGFYTVFLRIVPLTSKPFHEQFLCPQPTYIIASISGFLFLWPKKIKK